ncbi:MAG: PQQ-dependent sugar dehydrogenase, partial [Patescibacteria group bacterium]
GRGPLELNTEQGNTTADGDYPAFQRVFWADGRRRDKTVGTIFWHQIHAHYHYKDFADYELEMVRPANDAKEPSPPAVTQKTTFCMRDDEFSPLPSEGPRQKKTYTGCRGHRQGVSVGWVDVYLYSLPDQYFDVTDFPSGLYRLSFSVDPQERFVESRRDNNKSSAFLELDSQKRTVRVVASAAPFATPKNQFPDGMLIQSQEKNDVFVMRNNKRRLLYSDEIITSYGYDRGNIVMLPQGVIDAIPRDTLIRLSGTNKIYALNDFGFRRHILNPEIFSSYGWTMKDVATINETEFSSYPESDLIMRKGDDSVYSTSRREIVTRYDADAVHVVNTTEFNTYAGVKIVATGLSVPWDIVFLPDGDMLVTERTGTLQRIGKNPATIAFPSVLHVGEGGLMGIALHPDFAENKFIYVYYTTTDNGKQNRVSRFRLDGDALKDEKIIIDAIPAALYHDGGQIAFGPDGMLYLTTGDAERPEVSQDIYSLAGKTLRLTPDGAIPSDNPFGNAVWSYGHRNAQGIAWDDSGRMWQTEHGRSGALSGLDELNLIEKGKNYGWPIIQGDAEISAMVRPVRHSGHDVTWAPSGIAYAKGALYFAGLRGSSLYVAPFGNDGAITGVHPMLSGVYGRLRAVVLGPDGFLYITTSNKDGRGTVRAGDDKILRVHPDFLRKP